MADGVKTTEQLLAERQSTHGEYSEHARATQSILRVLQAERRWPQLSDMQKESLHMLAHKMGRIVTGNPDIADHWDDIAGYSKLISQRLEKPIEPSDIGRDVYMALALAWGTTRDEAKRRTLELANSGGRELGADEVEHIRDVQRAMTERLGQETRMARTHPNARVPTVLKTEAGEFRVGDLVEYKTSVFSDSHVGRILAFEHLTHAGSAPTIRSVRISVGSSDQWVDINPHLIRPAPQSERGVA